MEVSWQRAIRNRGALFHTSVLDQARYCLFQDERGCHFLDLFGGKGLSHIFHCGCFITPGLTQQMRMLIKTSESLWCLVPYYKNWSTRYICFKIISQHCIASCLRQNWNDDFTILKWMVHPSWGNVGLGSQQRPCSASREREGWLYTLCARHHHHVGLSGMQVLV